MSSGESADQPESTEVRFVHVGPAVVVVHPLNARNPVLTRLPAGVLLVRWPGRRSRQSGDGKPAAGVRGYSFG